MAVHVGGAPKDPKSEEQYEEINRVVEDDLKLITRKMGIILRSLSGKKIRSELRWYDLSNSAAMVAAVNAQDLHALGRLHPSAKDSTGLYLFIMWADDRSLFAVQVVEPRPWEGGRYALMSPTLVYTDEDAQAASELIVRKK